MDKPIKSLVEIANGINHIEESQEGLLKGGFTVLIIPEPENSESDDDINLDNCKCNHNYVPGCGSPTSKESSKGNMTVILSF